MQLHYKIDGWVYYSYIMKIGIFHLLWTSEVFLGFTGVHFFYDDSKEKQNLAFLKNIDVSLRNLHIA